MDSPTVYLIKVVIGIGVIGGAILYFIIYIIEQRDLGKEEKKSALSGTINSKIIPGQNFVTVHYGENSMTVSIESLRTGLPYYPLSILHDANIGIRLKDEQIVVSATFRSLDGKIVAEIIDNEWQVNPNNYFDRNYDDNGLEIIDQDKITKFQIDYTDIYNIRFGGSFLSNNTIYAIFPDGLTYAEGGVDKMKKEYLIDITKPIRTLFEYPSDKYFGERKEVPDVEFYPELITDFPDNKERGKILRMVYDTMEVKSIRFGGEFKNSKQLQLKLRVIKFEVYFNNKFQSQGVVGEDILLSSKEEWRTPEVYFNEAMESIPFSEAKKIEYRFFITTEYSDINSGNKKPLNIGYSVILTDTGPAYLDISK